MNDFMKGFIVISGGILAAQILSFPLTEGLNSLAVQICKHSPDRGLVSYDENSIFGGRKIACVPKKYI